jgi:hypothetical protein
MRRHTTRWAYNPHTHLRALSVTLLRAVCRASAGGRSQQVLVLVLVSSMARCGVSLTPIELSASPTQPYAAPVREGGKLQQVMVLVSSMARR